MDIRFWQKQEPVKPLFPDILWSRPETKAGAGKLAIVGGHAHGFGAPGIAYGAALEAGAGTCRVLLPDAVKKTVGMVLPDADFAPSNRSGSFAKNSLSELLAVAHWADSVLLAGDFGRNSETAVVLEDFVRHYTGQLTITQDAADYFKAFPKLLLERESTMLVVSLAQLQKIFINAPLMHPITYGMSPLQLAEALRDLTSQFGLCVLTKHHDQVFVAKDGRVTTTAHNELSWRVKTAAKASVFWLHNPQKTLEAATTALVQEASEPL